MLSTLLKSAGCSLTRDLSNTRVTGPETAELAKSLSAAWTSSWSMSASVGSRSRSTTGDSERYAAVSAARAASGSIAAPSVAGVVRTLPLTNLTAPSTGAVPDPAASLSRAAVMRPSSTVTTGSTSSPPV
jgi:hypothetical protein